MEELKLSFAALDAQIEKLPQHPSHSTVISKKARWGFAIGLGAGMLGLLAAKLLPSNQVYTVVIAGSFLIIELVGMGVALASQIPTSWPTFASARREAADELDFDLPHHQSLIHWLQDFPRDQLETLSSFISYRHERMREKLPLLTGSIEKLGALPIFIALFIQFKDLHWPPQPSWLEIVLIFGLILGYWVSLLQISVRFRLQAYDMLLKNALTEANHRADNETGY